MSQDSTTQSKENRTKSIFSQPYVPYFTFTLLLVLILGIARFVVPFHLKKIFFSIQCVLYVFLADSWCAVFVSQSSPLFSTLYLVWNSLIQIVSTLFGSRRKAEREIPVGDLAELMKKRKTN